MDPSLSHLNARGEVHMVDVAGKATTAREAVAEGYLRLAPEALALVREGRAGKGDVLAVARVAAIQAAKRTADLIPLCHPLPLSGLEVRISEAPLPPAGNMPPGVPAPVGLRIEATVRTTAPTGVEMEALTAVQVGLLTLYDMLKSADRAMTIGPVQLLRKRGGRSGDWQRPGEEANG
ncbi:cyclic pyranopterin monophosphate synthase MoaC [Cyanobium sp. FGCU-52]|nr:cyclic pyranopterin monophosphate synthase MoaC [Cyanobium sp. FGCU52]